MFKKVLFFSLFPCFQLFSHPIKMAKITGSQIKLETIGHSFAGSIKNRVVMGHKKAGQFVSELKIIEADQETVSFFSPTEKEKFSGDLHVLRGGQKETHSIKFIELNKEDHRYVMSFDHQVVDVFVKADSFKSGHFINPEYSMTYQGEKISFKLEGGAACYGYSLHLIAMIMGTRVF